MYAIYNSLPARPGDHVTQQFSQRKADAGVACLHAKDSICFSLSGAPIYEQKKSLEEAKDAKQPLLGMQRLKFYNFRQEQEL